MLLLMMELTAVLEHHACKTLCSRISCLHFSSGGLVACAAMRQMQVEAYCGVSACVTPRTLPAPPPCPVCWAYTTNG